MSPETHTRRKSEEPYLLGTDPEEGLRLETQHRVWGEAARDLWDRAGFGMGARLLDLGCGPGFAALELAARVGARGPGAGRRRVGGASSPLWSAKRAVSGSSSSRHGWRGSRSCG